MHEIPTTKSGWRIARRIVIALAVIATLIAIFYTEEDWRGKRTWENCKKNLEAQGVVLDWNKFLPPSVPDDQNFYTTSSNILERFKQHESTNDPDYQMALDNPWLRLNRPPNWFPIYDTASNGPIVVAKIIISPQVPALELDSNALVVSFNDPGAVTRTRQLVQLTIGQTICGAEGFEFSQFQLTNLQPAQIFIQADTPPSATDLAGFILSDTIGEHGRLRIVATAEPKIFQVQLTNLRITSAADYLAWSDQYVPAFNDIREALKRPDAILPCDYSQPYQMPIPNFVTMRALAQTLAQRAQCYLLLGKPEQALHELTLVHDVCRILEKPPTGQPETLVEAMINVAITGLYVAVIEEGMKRHAWQEPQLEVFQEQLGQVNLQIVVDRAFQNQPAFMCRDAETIPPQRWLSIVGGGVSLPARLLWLMPRGWVYQNIAVSLRIQQLCWNGLDSANQIVFPQKLDASMRKAQRELGHHHSPFYLLADIAIPNFSKVWQVTAENQTLANEGQIACALERCRLMHGEYPDSLDTLVPGYLETIPKDIIGGQPLHYRRTDDGKFLLYSVGWNERDDGGKTVLNGSGIPILTSGDWVWSATTK